MDEISQRHRDRGQYTTSIPTFSMYCKGGCSVTTTGTVDVSITFTVGYVAP